MNMLIAKSMLHYIVFYDYVALTVSSIQYNICTNDIYEYY